MKLTIDKLVNISLLVIPNRRIRIIV